MPSAAAEADATHAKTVPKTQAEEPSPRPPCSLSTATDTATPAISSSASVSMRERSADALDLSLLDVSLLDVSLSNQFAIANRANNAGQNSHTTVTTAMSVNWAAKTNNSQLPERAVPSTT